MFDDSTEGTALMQILGCVCLQEAVDPIVAMLDDVVTELSRDGSERFFGLGACLSDRTTVDGAIGHVPFYLRPQKFDRLHLRAERRRIHQRVPCVVHQLLYHGLVVVRMFE